MKKLALNKTISRLLLLASVVLFILLYPAIALAAGTVEPTALDRLSTEVLNVLIPVFVAFIGGLAAWLLAKMQKKLGLELSDKTHESWSNLARKGALRAAEWARNKAKNLTEDKKIPGPEILEVGANWAIDMGKAYKLPEIGRAKLEGLIEAELFQLRREENGSEPSNPI